MSGIEKLYGVQNSINAIASQIRHEIADAHKDGAEAERARIKEEFKKYHRLEAKFTLNQCKEKDGLYYIDVTELFYGLVDQVLGEH